MSPLKEPEQTAAAYEPRCNVCEGRAAYCTACGRGVPASNPRWLTAALEAIKEAWEAGQSDWVECPKCEGAEGHFDTKTDDWIDCPTCAGQGGWSR